MKKNIVTFLILICLSGVNHNYLKGEKPNCKFQCVSPKVADEINTYDDGIIPYYPFLMGI